MHCLPMVGVNHAWTTDLRMNLNLWLDLFLFASIIIVGRYLIMRIMFIKFIIGTIYAIRRNGWLFNVAIKDRWPLYLKGASG